MRDIALGHFTHKICDPSKGAIDPKSGRHVADMYKDYEIEFTDANNDVDTGIFKVLNNFRWNTLKIFTSCVHTIAELRTYQYDKNGKIKKTNDDLMDCLRYLLNEDVEHFSSNKYRQSSADKVAEKLLKAQKTNRLF